MVISYMEAYTIFCKRMDCIKIFVMSLDFVEIKKNHVDRDDIQGTFSPSTAIFWFISDDTIYQNKS